jgi:betaine-aldehyde dehydrogenase
MKYEFQAQASYYDGKRQQASHDGHVFQSMNPATNKPLANIHTSTAADIEAAIDSASKAFQSWSKTAPMERSRILLRAVGILRSRNDELATVETLDTGKAFSETSAVDVVTGADVLEYYANMVAGGGLNGEYVKLGEDTFFYSTKEPLGVCVGIGAWNYPIQM